MDVFRATDPNKNPGLSQESRCPRRLQRLRPVVVAAVVAVVVAEVVAAVAPPELHPVLPPAVVVVQRLELRLEVRRPQRAAVPLPAGPELRAVDAAPAAPAVLAVVVAEAVAVGQPHPLLLLCRYHLWIFGSPVGWICLRGVG